MNRKDAMKLMAASMMVPTVACSLGSEQNNYRKTAGRIKQSVVRWCFNNIPLEELADAAVEMGYGSVELLGANEWDIVLKRGLTCAMAYANDHGLTRGFNDPSLHASLLEQYSANIPKAADAGLKQVIAFSGNRNGMDNQVGMDNCARGLEPVIKVAEKYDIIVSMELLNSKRDHADYMCDQTDWGVKLVDKVGSPNFRLLYDIYHMQVQEGNIIDTIKKYGNYFSHYHTAGVPGRNEINNSQELYYPAIMEAIADSGFSGFIGQEFIPKSDDKLASLGEAFAICDV